MTVLWDPYQCLHSVHECKDRETISPLMGFEPMTSGYGVVNPETCRLFENLGSQPSYKSDILTVSYGLS